jgi:hypothetical protein
VVHGDDGDASGKASHRFAIFGLTDVHAVGRSAGGRALADRIRYHVGAWATWLAFVLGISETRMLLR